MDPNQVNPNGSDTGRGQNVSNRLRYPGAGPFSEAQRDIFFGREKDLEALLRMVARHQQVVLYAKSGIGKSSLLQAGLIPSLREQGWICLRVRFHAHSASGLSPLRRLLQVSPDPELPEFLGRLYEENSNSLWFRYKASQLAFNSRILLLFDQFEELFTYPQDEVDAFKGELAQLMYQTVPEDVRRKLRELETNGVGLTEDEFDRLFEPMQIKMVVALREDRMSHIQDLTDALPDLRHHWMEIKPLGREQARRAIVNPAALEGDFAVPPFRYSEEALDRILTHLTRGNKVPVETTQLQIVCQKVVETRMAILGSCGLEIGLDDLPDLNDVLRNFYCEVIANLPERLRKTTQIFIEDELIHAGMRIPVAESICEQRLGRPPLQYLVRRHLLRMEPNSTGAFSYELCHDILVSPILDVSAERKAEEALEERRLAENRLKLELELAQIEDERNQRRLRRRNTLIVIILVLLAGAVGAIWYAWNLTNELQRSIMKEQEMTDSLQIVVTKYEKERAARKASVCANWALNASNLVKAGEFELAQRCFDSISMTCGDSTQFQVNSKRLY